MIIKKKDFNQFGIIYIIIGLFLSSCLGDNGRFDEYKRVKKEDSFEGEIIHLYITHGACFITLPSIKILPATKYNKMYENDKEIKFSHNVCLGDTLKKEAGSDSIKLCKKSKIYSYKLNFVDENEKFYEKVKR